MVEPTERPEMTGFDSKLVLSAAELLDRAIPPREN